MHNSLSSRHMSRRNRAVAMICVMLLLSACKGGAPAPTATPLPPTVPLVITRVVTPMPTPTPLPPPTPVYDISPIIGRWYLRVDMSISGSRLAQEFRYWGTLDLLVERSGVVSGTGSFSPAIADPPCEARVMGGEPLAFTAQGTTFFDGTALGIDVQLRPANAEQIERYRVSCTALEDRWIEQPILWPALSVLSRQNVAGATFAGLHWRIPLQVGWTYAFSADLATLTGGTLDGLLTLEVRPARG